MYPFVYFYSFLQSGSDVPGRCCHELDEAPCLWGAGLLGGGETHSRTPQKVLSAVGKKQNRESGRRGLVV